MIKLKAYKLFRKLIVYYLEKYFCCIKNTVFIIYLYIFYKTFSEYSANDSVC